MTTTTTSPPLALSGQDYAMLLHFLYIQSHTNDQKKLKGYPQTDKMRRAARMLAREMGCQTQQHEGNLYITKGEAEIYPCFVAHLDTVHPIVPDDEYKVFYDPNTNDLFALNPKDQTKQQGIGGDDKVGIAIAFIMLRDLPACKVALFRDEEIGGVGASFADMDFFKNCAWAIECDRRGSSDVVRNAGGTELHGKDFADAIKPAMDKWNRKYAHGALTDVKILKGDGLPICAMNMSCGYYNPHTKDEYIRQEDVANCIEFCKHIVEITIHQKWEHVYIKPVYVPYVQSPESKAEQERRMKEWEAGAKDRDRTPNSQEFCKFCSNELGKWSAWCRHCMKSIPVKDRVIVMLPEPEPEEEMHGMIQIAPNVWMSKEYHDETKEEEAAINTRTMPSQQALDWGLYDDYEYEQCTQCKKWIWDDTNFCPYCKSALDDPKYAQSAPPEECPECTSTSTGWDWAEESWYCFVCDKMFDLEPATGLTKDDLVAINFMDDETRYGIVG